jgi:hypothetical protein
MNEICHVPTYTKINNIKIFQIYGLSAPWNVKRDDQERKDWRREEETHKKDI